MNVRPSNYLAALALGALALSGLATGCELIASVDRSKIPEATDGAGGAGGTTASTGGAGGTSTGTGGAGGTSTGTGGTGGQAGQGGKGGSGGAACDPACGAPAEPDCESIACVDGKCESTFQPDGTKLPDPKQTAGDCKVVVCDGKGATTAQNDDTDRVTDANDCMSHTCDQGTPKSAPTATGTACMTNNGSVCDGKGLCVQCNVGEDCKDAAKPVCKESQCVAATCSDGIKNGTETDKDCGGSCTPCDTDFACAVANDCKSKNCKNNLCAAPTCDDGIQNGNETETDCGGGCKGCGPTQKCAVDADCLGKQCDANNKTCTPNCLDTVKNGNETDVDCGGDACGKCAETKLCKVAGDCTSNGCCAGTCSACCNGVKDGNEADLDCGGSCATKCGDFKACAGNADCLSGLCQNFQCKPGTCSNGAKDGDETDVDCGGSCQPCAAGKVCTKIADCASGFCTDGVCCNAKCDGLCEACTKAKTGLADGACNAVPNGSDPDNECAQDQASTCKQNGFCNGQRVCAKYDAATECSAPSCTNGTQTNASKCDGKGTCPAATTQACGQFICGANACKTSCAVDGDCIAGDFCENPGANGVCKAKLALGGVCTGNNQCVGGACVDGFCCNTVCNGECQACSAAKTGGTNGTCAPIQNGQDPDNECADQGVATCGTTGVCNGANACAKYAVGSQCAAPACSNGDAVSARLCDGAGVCQNATTTDCGAFACVNAVCNATCATEADCAANNWCDTSGDPDVCKPKGAAGATCNSGQECLSGTCAPSDGGPSTCN